MKTHQVFDELLDQTLAFATEREVLQQKIKKEKNEIPREVYEEKIEVIEDIVSKNVDTLELIEGNLPEHS